MYAIGLAISHSWLLFSILTLLQTGRSHKVTQFQLHGWLDSLPPANDITAGLMSMIDEIQKVQYIYNTHNDLVVVHCRYVYWYFLASSVVQ